MKILLVFYEPMPAGQTTHVLSLARALDNCKYRVTVVLPANLQRSIAAFRQAGVEVVPLPLRKVVWSPQAVVTLARLIRRQDIDIVHVHSQEAGLLGRLVARAAGARRVIYTPQTIDIRRVRFHWLYVLIERILARVTDVIISVNEPDRERLIRWGIPPHKIVIIPNGIDLSPSAPSTTLMTGSLGVNSIEGTCPACPERSRGKPAEGPVDVGSLRRALGLDEDRPLVMQVARLSAQKDPLAFVEGAAHVVRERPDVQFALVGEGPLTEATAKRVRALGLDEHVHLLGWRDEAFNLMAAADVVSLTSRWEGAPHTLLEAMAWSRPVVATAVNGCPEIVVDGGTGFLVPPGDTKAWARRIIDLLSDPVMAAAMGREGRIRVEERFSLREMAARIEGPYQQAAQAHKRPQVQHPRITAGSVLSSIFRSFQRE
ncbi:MAG: glycosyltransferase family 4 protein [Chloroflexi bacterium]|nr:glycosyltransferase family 4 protein [Chloroflexota bacterium]